jgi:flagellar hook-associated protein 2
VFSINGHQVTVSTADSLQDVFSAISTATGGDVVAAYDPVADKVSLSSITSSPITLGAANDTSNLLRVLKLANNGAATVQSSAAVAALSTTAVLASAGLKSAPSNVDASGNGSFLINGTTISYNVNSDSLAAVLKSINTSGAGVTASYDGTNDRVVLTNNRPGNLGISVSESGSGLLSALGLVSGATLQSGSDAQFTLNGGPVLSASGNTLEAVDHGLTGLSVTVTSTGTQTLTVGTDTTSMRKNIDAFISAYNAVQSDIDEKTKVTTANGNGHDWSADCDA